MNMRTALAAELRSELKDFLQAEVAKNIPVDDNRRKQARTTADMQIDGYSTTVGASSSGSPTAARRVTWRPSVPTPNPRTLRVASAPAGPQTSTDHDPDEHLVLTKLPEPVHEKFVRPWWDSLVAMLSSELAPTEVAIRPFHNFLSLFYPDAQSANGSAAALRALNQKMTTRDGQEKGVVIIRDRPPRSQRCGRGIHPSYAILLRDALREGEERKPLLIGPGVRPPTRYLMRFIRAPAPRACG